MGCTSSSAWRNYLDTKVSVDVKSADGKWYAGQVAEVRHHLRDCAKDRVCVRVLGGDELGLPDEEWLSRSSTRLAPHNTFAPHHVNAWRLMLAVGDKVDAVHHQLGPHPAVVVNVSPHHGLPAVHSALHDVACGGVQTHTFVRVEFTGIHEAMWAARTSSRLAPAGTLPYHNQAWRYALAVGTAVDCLDVDSQEWSEAVVVDKVDAATIPTTGVHDFSGVGPLFRIHRLWTDSGADVWVRRFSHWLADAGNHADLSWRGVGPRDKCELRTAGEWYQAVVEQVDDANNRILVSANGGRHWCCTAPLTEALAPFGRHTQWFQSAADMPAPTRYSHSTEVDESPPPTPTPTKAHTTPGRPANLRTPVAGTGSSPPL